MFNVGKVSCKQPPSVRDHLGFTFWVVTDRSFNCIYSFFFNFCCLYLLILTVAVFSKFSALQELELPLNNISDSIKVQPDMFECLMTLDLSYNRLSGDDILALGLLNSLRTLHLTGK